MGALLAPAAAAASTETSKFSGAVEGDENSAVHFAVHRKHGKTYVRKGAGWMNLDLICDDERREVSTSFDVSARVRRDGRFKLDSSAKRESEVYLRGTIEHSAAAGTLRFKGSLHFDDGYHDCDSGVQKWSAKRVTR